MAYQYYLLSHPSSISNNDWTNYSSFRCLNRMTPQFGSSTKLVNYNDLLINGSPISSDRYDKKYIPNNYTNAKNINNNLTALYGPKPSGYNEHMLLYYNDMTHLGPFNYISWKNTDHGYIYTPIVMPTVSWFLQKYNSGRQREGSVTQNYNSQDYKIRWYNTSANTISIYTASGATPGTTFPATSQKYAVSVSHSGPNYAICGYHYYYIGFGTTAYNWNDSVTKPVLYIGSTSDSISFNVCLLIEYGVITGNIGFSPSFTNYAFYNLLHTSSQEISDPLLNPSLSSQYPYDFVLINDTTTYTLSVSSPTDVNLMDAFDRIMTSKFGSSYNSSYHRLSKNSIYHYFFLCCGANLGLTETTMNMPMNQLNGGYDVDGIYYVLGKYTSSNESPGSHSCTVIDCYYTGNKVYIIECGILAIKNLKYTYYEDNTIDNQTISSLLTNYPDMVAMTNGLSDDYLTYDASSSNDTPSTNPGVFYRDCKVSDDVRFATAVSGGDSYWYNGNTWDSDSGIIGLSYAYAYAYTS